MHVHNETGEAVELLAQDAAGNCTFRNAARHKVTVPSHVFFASYREPTADELKKPAKPPADDTKADEKKGDAK